MAVPMGSKEKDVSDDGGFELVFGRDWGLGGVGFGGDAGGCCGEDEGVVDRLSGLWKEVGGDGVGNRVGAGMGDLFRVGEGAKLVRFSGAEGRFLMVVIAKGEMASAIAWVLIGSSSP